MTPEGRYASLEDLRSRFPHAWPWRYFQADEIACRCQHDPPCVGAGALLILPDFVSKLDALRAAYGRPLGVTSWYRSPVHNAKVSSTGTGGPHTTGRAVDFAVSGADAYRLLRLACEQGFTGIGVSQKGAGRFLHLDDLETAGRPWIWSY